jgi:hypothetical protein
MNRKKLIKDNVRIGLFEKMGFKHLAKGQERLTVDDVIR